eukprot:PhF_6_TR43325/c1_g1_i1/m.66222
MSSYSRQPASPAVGTPSSQRGPVPTPASGGGGPNTSGGVSKSGVRDDRYALEVKIQQLEHELDGKKKAIAKLESEGIQHLRTISDMKAEEEARRAQQQYYHKKELETEREKIRMAQAELNVEKERVASMDARLSRMEHDALRLPIVEARANELDSVYRDKQAELEECKRARSALEFKILELQSTSQTRVLEGKLAMVQQLLEERSNEILEEQKKTNAANLKVEDLKAVMAELQKRTSVLERENGECVMLLEQRTKDMEKAEERLKAVRLEAEENLTKVLAIQHEKEELEIQHETSINDVRSEMRTKIRVVSQLEMDRATLTDRLAETQAQLQREKGESEKLTLQLFAVKDEHAAACRRIEEWECTSARDNVALKGMKDESDRLRRTIDDLKREVREGEEAKGLVEQRAHLLEQEARRKGALEEQVRSLQMSLERQDQDLKNELLMHQDTKRRLAEALESTQKMTWCTERLKETETELESMQEHVDKVTAQSQQSEATIEELKREIDRELARHNKLEDDLRQEMDHRSELEARIVELEHDSMRKCALEGKCQGLEDMITQRQTEINELIESNNRLNLELRDAQYQVGTIEPLEERLKESTLERHRLQQCLDDTEDRRREMEREIATLTSRTRQRESELDDERNRYRELEEEMLRCKQIIAEKIIVEERFREATHNLQLRQEENDRMRNHIDELRTNLRNAETLAASQDENIRDLQAKLQSELEVVQQQMVEAGKQAISYEALDRERQRLVKEIEWRTQQSEMNQNLSRRMQDELSARISQVEKLEVREQSLNTVVEELNMRLDESENRGQTVKLQLASSQQRVTELENRLSDMLLEQHKRIQNDGKIAAMEKLLEQRESENNILQQTATELRLKMREVEAELMNAKQTELKLRELRQANARQASQLEVQETEIAQKVSVMLEKDKEGQRDREVIRELNVKIEEELMKRNSLELKIRDLEAENARKNALEGKVRGLETLIEERTKDLQQEREETLALRQKLKSMEKGYSSVSRLEDTLKELEAQLAIKSDTIQRLESEESRRRNMFDRQRQDQIEVERSVISSQDEISRLKIANTELQTTLMEYQKESQTRIRQLVEELKLKSIEADKAIQAVGEYKDKAYSESNTAGRSADRIKVAEDEVWTLKRALAQLEHESGTSTAVIDDLKRQLAAERAQSMQLNVLVSQLRDRQVDAEGALRAHGVESSSREVSLIAELKARDAEVLRLSQDLSDMKNQLAKRGNDTTVVSRLQSEVDELKAQLRRQALMPLESKDRTVMELEARLRDEENRVAELNARLRGQDASAIAIERDTLRNQVTKLKQQLADVVRDDTQRMQGYENQISALSHKSVVADEAVERLREMTRYVEDLRRDNLRLRDENVALSESRQSSMTPGGNIPAPVRSSSAQQQSFGGPSPQGVGPQRYVIRNSPAVAQLPLSPPRGPLS